MKQLKFTAIMLAICLAGCASHGPIPEETAGPQESSVAQQVQPTEPPETTAAPTLPAATEPEITQPEPEEDAFVQVSAYIPDIMVDLRYASQNNFTGRQIYDFSQVWLRYGTVKKLMAVQDALKEKGLLLKIWDGFRPPAAQFALWEICPDPTYVSNPNKGFSSHSRGNTVDITLVRSDGTELTMPTGFDDFTKLADRDYSDCSQEAAANALFLEELMIAQGFKPYFGEWWHFSDCQSYPVEETFLPVEAASYYAHCQEFISLRTHPDVTAEVITKIPAGARFQVVARHGDFALIEYRNVYGYVLFQYIQPI